MSYSNKVLDHYENPRNVGSFAKHEINIGTGMVGAPACGDETTNQSRRGYYQRCKIQNVWMRVSNCE